ncbi:snRNA-activating protein complex subunit 3 [Pseudomyrmex gracilis]|uniref:snRNA-activating protein complex subunit 3 n=1 Tax=Pseudomyrmex gracilis TaxID=219809 RepID=UPI000995267A|nr:snRNA-activating protein complex subunit 3 [Pseudomyrmex gracilis]
MDEVYSFYNRHASKKLNMTEYFKEYSEIVKPIVHREDQSDEERLSELMNANLTEARKSLIASYCSIDNLTISIETTITEEKDKHEYLKMPENILDKVPLETIKILKSLIDSATKSGNLHGIPIKYDKVESSSNDSVKPYEEFLVYVRVYEPFNHQAVSLRHKMKVTVFPTLKLKCTISILGCQTLYDLRQKISCLSDLTISTEVSENPDQEEGSLAKNVYKSGFFYIEDTFYNDSSDPNNVDYSSVIIEWSKHKNRNIGPFKVATMDTRINTLVARFGFPWVYQHQGNCEHVIVLSDARLVTEKDELTYSAYPRVERIKPFIGKNCIMCGILNVHWIITEHDRIPHDLSYWCDKCFVSYNYIDGKKIGNFKAYKYPRIPKLMYINKKC